MDIQAPKDLTLLTHLRIFSGQKTSLHPALEPILKTPVFLLLSRRPEIELNCSKSYRAAVKYSLESSRIIVASLANWLIFISSPCTEISLIALFCLIFSAKSSTQRIKM